MRYIDLACSGMMVFVDRSQYQIHFPHSFIDDDINTNGLAQPLSPGSFLIKIFNMDLTGIEESLSYLKSDLENISLGVISEEIIEDAFDNYRDTAASLMLNDITFDYSIAEKDIYLFSELLACEAFDNMDLISNNMIRVSDDITDIRKLRLLCHTILHTNQLTKEAEILIHQQMPQVIYECNNNQIRQGYYIRSISELFAVDACMYLSSPCKICFCKLCGKYFIKSNRNTEAYCTYPNPQFEGKSCIEKHINEPDYKDEITKLVVKATKTQNKYYVINGGDENASCWDLWFDELKRRENTARVDHNIMPLETFIKNTRFSRIGFSIKDFSGY